MKVLAIAGSPRRQGNTDLLLAELLKGAASKGAEVEAVFLQNLKFSTCVHCDSCLKEGKCRIQDDMQKIYDKLAEADVIVLASPVQFAGITAPLKAMIDRCQCLWARKYVLKIPPLSPMKNRRGFFLSVSGTRLKNMFEPSLAVVKTLFHVINVDYAGELLVSGVDEKGAILKHPEALQQAFQWGQKLAEGTARQGG
ncbi:MAG: flavodoxin family protein [Dehalococcoidales bacterium]|nr:flavodoxin family protein [Dehalococcoidales bacterium]